MAERARRTGTQQMPPLRGDGQKLLRMQRMRLLSREKGHHRGCGQKGRRVTNRKAEAEGNPSAFFHGIHSQASIPEEKDGAPNRAREPETSLDGLVLPIHHGRRRTIHREAFKKHLKGGTGPHCFAIPHPLVSPPKYPPIPHSTIPHSQIPHSLVDYRGQWEYTLSLLVSGLKS